MEALCFFLLAFCSRRLRPAELGYILALTVMAATVHFSHLPLAVGLLLITMLVRIACCRQAQIPPANTDCRTADICSPITHDGRELLHTRRSSLLSQWIRISIGAAGVADGQAVSYLREACPQRGYALCEYIDRLPNDSDEFLWSPDSPFRKVGSLAAARKVEIVLRTIMRFPLWTLRSALNNTTRQLFEVRTGSDCGVL